MLICHNIFSERKAPSLFNLIVQSFVNYLTNIFYKTVKTAYAGYSFEVLLLQSISFIFIFTTVALFDFWSERTVLLISIKFIFLQS